MILKEFKLVIIKDQTKDLIGWATSLNSNKFQITLISAKSCVNFLKIFLDCDFNPLD
jgi:hypothetical protein